MANNPPRLGRGLGTLIGKRESPAPPAAPGAGPPHAVVAAASGAIEDAKSGPILRELALSSIRPNPRQPRTYFAQDALTHLADSLRTQGVLQPIVVRPTGNGYYELVAGERRWRAAQIAGLSAIPAVIRQVTESQTLELALVENLQREDLTPLERARAYQGYIDRFAVTPEELAAKLSESRASVLNYLRLLKLPEEVQEFVRIGELGMGQARAIAALTDSARQLAIARMAVRRNLSVRQVEQLAKVPAGDPANLPDIAVSRETAQMRYASEVALAIAKALGVPVQLIPGKKKNSGRLVVQYRSLEEFDRIVERMDVRMPE